MNKKSSGASAKKKLNVNFGVGVGDPLLGRSGRRGGFKSDGYFYR